MLRSGATLLPGRTKVKGVNFTLHPDHGNEPRPAGHPGNWDQMYAAWDWDGWIKPQLDRIVAAGGNMTRTIGGINGLPVFGRNSYTEATYFNRLRQLYDYCGEIGLAVEGNGWDRGQWRADQTGSDAITAAEANDHLSRLAAVWAEYPDVVRCADIEQEIDWHADEYAGDPTSYPIAEILDDCATFAATVRAVAPNLPITFSFTELPANAETIIDNLKLGVVDYWSCHTYLYDPAAASYNILRSRSLQPILIGEWGVNQSQTELVRTTRATAVVTVAALSYHLGQLYWAAADQATGATPAAQWGLWDNSGVARDDVKDIWDTSPLT